LRYDTVVANFGKGPMELRYRVDGLLTDQQLRQRIYKSDGTHTEYIADRYEFHPTHTHFHYANFAIARLWDSNEEGERLGDEPVRESNKAGYCLFDQENAWEGRKRGTEQRYRDPEACRPNDVRGTQVSQINGLSVGWMDVYNYELSDQYIDISGLTPGYYILEIEVDPLDTLIESKQADNDVSVFILLTEEDVSLP
jgi:hypothetical protein